MANIYVRSTDGLDTDNGSTWALAKLTINGAAAIDAAGDTIYVSQAHSESNAATVTWAFAGTQALPVKVICGNDAAAPPTAAAVTGVVATGAGFAINITGCAYFYGLTFNIGSGTTSSASTWASNDNDVQYFEECNFNMVTTAAASVLRAGSTTASTDGAIYFRNCTFQFSNASQGLSCRNVPVKIVGGNAVSDINITAFIQAAAQGICNVEIDNFNFTNWGVNMSPFGGGAGILRAKMRHCKFAPSWVGNLVSGAQATGSRVEMHNCDSGDTNYRLWIEDFFGSVRDEATIVRSGGASDGTTALAWKMTSSADAEYPHQGLIGPDIAIWNTTVGSPITVTLEIVNDGATLTDGQLWMSLDYMGTTGHPLGTRVRSGSKSSPLASATAYPTSSATWGGSLASPVKQKLSVTVTPRKVGFLIARVILVDPSRTIYVDPELTVT